MPPSCCLCNLRSHKLGCYEGATGSLRGEEGGVRRRGLGEWEVHGGRRPRTPAGPRGSSGRALPQRCRSHIPKDTVLSTGLTRWVTGHPQGIDRTVEGTRADPRAVSGRPYSLL